MRSMSSAGHEKGETDGAELTNRQKNRNRLTEKCRNITVDVTRIGPRRNARPHLTVRRAALNDRDIGGVSNNAVTIDQHERSATWVHSV